MIPTARDHRPRSSDQPRSFVLRALALTLPLASLAAQVPTTLEDFHVPGTQMGDVPAGQFQPSDNCAFCHGGFDPENEIHTSWKGSLMALGGKDPLFFAQMSTANQDAAEVGYYCLRCHVPASIVTGHAVPTNGSALNAVDLDGVTCHFCHSMVDPIYKPGISPPEDQAILAALPDKPEHYGNAMFVLDPELRRRGPLSDPQAPHEAIYSPFHTSSDLCGTCHDVGNVATQRLPNGNWRYNTLGMPADDPDPRAQFPLERTYTEWKLSQFANGGVDMGGRFGGLGQNLIESCQDCHMPKVRAQACPWGPQRDLPRHDFAGAAVPSLQLIAALFAGDPNFDHQAVQRGISKALSMLRRGANVETLQDGGALRVRTTNETGHKLPTGHIEGRRVWVNVRFQRADGALAREYGAYDVTQAVLDEPSTRVYEMEVGLSGDAAAITGLPIGRTTHMALADTIVKDNRIPPRGFSNAAFEAGGAPVVEHHYADGQYWDDTWFAIPRDAAAVAVTVNYQSLTRHYIEALRDGNVTDPNGQILYDLWTQTGKGAPIPMVRARKRLAPFLFGDVDLDGQRTANDLAVIQAAWGKTWEHASFPPRADLDGDHAIGAGDAAILQELLANPGS
jgi:hypothetical protein